MKAKLTKSYLFPLVRGSQFSVIATYKGVLNGFVHFIKTLNGYQKVSNYDGYFNSFLNSPLTLKKGYKTFGKEVDSVIKANKYLDKQYCRMAKALKEDDIIKYTKIFEMLKVRSDTYLLVILVRKLPFYAINYSPAKVKSLMIEIRSLLKRESQNLKVKRVFLPELNPDGSIRKHRPLGVPSVQWRVISAMYEMYLVNILKKTWNNKQYACMPGRGVADAWIEILQHVQTTRHIVGIDLSKFFDTVFIKAVGYSLERKGIPSHIKDFLTGICYNEAKVKPIERALEKERIDSLNKEVPLDRLAIDIPEMLSQGFPKRTPRMYNERSVGLPQGVATSPLLACLVLNDTTALNEEPIPGTNERIIHYMDDAVLMNDLGPFIQLDDYMAKLNHSSTGILVSEKKTELIKWSGKWKKPLKFLGCEYDGQTFKANTRKGGIFVVPDASSRIEEIIDWLTINKKDLKGYSRTKLNKLISSGWNHVGDFMISNQDKVDWSLWERYRLIITNVNGNSVEARVAEKYFGSKNPVIGSTNTLSMLNSGYMLNFIDRYKAKGKSNQSSKLDTPTLSW